MLPLVLLAGAAYFLNIDDGKYKQGDWSSTPYAVSEYVNGVTIEKDGTIKSKRTAEKLWDKMVKNKSRVNVHLKDAKELAKLMRAETATQYPDTRPNPDKDIDWEKLKGDEIQGIIKFKRALDNGNKMTMSYVDPDTFQSYIDEYNTTGSEIAKTNALNHFTLQKSTSNNNNLGGGNNTNNDDAVASRRRCYDRYFTKNCTSCQ